MFRPLECFIGLRYTRAKRRNHFISFISMVSMLGIAVGITALITVISVMNGFDYQLRSRILGMVADATVTGIGESVQNWQHAVAVAEQDPHVLGAAPYVERFVMIQGARPDAAGAMIRGVDPKLESKVSDIGEKMVMGHLSDLQPGSWNIILGRDLAISLGVRLGDKVVVYAAKVAATPIGVLPRLKRFTVSGIFYAGMAEYDAGMAVVNMRDAARLYSMDGPTGIRLKLDDLFQARQVASHVDQALGGQYQVQGWMQSHKNFFSAVALEKKVMFIILSLIIAVAAFNLVSTLVMLVTDKQADIAILRTLGATPRSIMGIFMVQGLLVGIIGIAFGVLCGVLLALNLPDIVQWIEHTFHVTFMSADVYYISELPSNLHWDDVGWITALAFAFCLLATIYPAWRASRTQPAEALRYE
ncbi:MAG: lipoprotein-releasing ABC transporter permease subunit [Xanthomonadales bacterium]|nr:lipoprotein-releasing ABC transporter permease subunit [Xanthomonadales bacterium]